MKEYTPIPTSDVEQAPAPARRSAWKRSLPVLALFALIGVLAVMNPAGCGKAEHAIKNLKVPGYAHLSEVDDVFAFDEDKPHHHKHKPHHHHHDHHSDVIEYTSATMATALKEASCPAQPKSLSVGPDWDPEADKEYAHKAAERLSKAVQINTVSTDDLPDDPTDPRFDGHYKFAEFLESEYPTVFETLKHETINTHGHLFTWEGTNKDLKPIFLMAHEDTVPVNPDTVDQWTFPPWSGEITEDATLETPGTWIWGRGASDCKNSLIGILHSVEKLVGEGFQPGRTILIGYGFDEEVSYAEGVGLMADWRCPRCPQDQGGD